MLVKEKVFLFKNDSSKFQEWQIKTRTYKEKTKILINKAAEILGINEDDLKNKITTSTQNQILISNNLAEKYGFSKKIIVLGSDDMAIRDEKTKQYLGQWSLLKGNTKFFKEIEKIKDELDIDDCPDIREHFLNSSHFFRIKCRRIILDEYGAFFIIENDYLDDRNLKEALNEAVEIKMSKFYKLLEKIDEEKGVGENGKHSK